MPTLAAVAARANVTKNASTDAACLICRRRKIKCDRERPHCSTCAQTEQECSYPTEVLKPGPKIGSFRKGRRRPQSELSVELEEDDGLSQAASRPKLTHVQSTGSVRRAAEALTELRTKRKRATHIRDQPIRSPSDAASESDGSIFAAEVSDGAGAEDCSAEPADNVHIRSMSSILHPSHEVYTPSVDKSVTAAGLTLPDPPDSNILLETCCKNLGVSAHQLNLILDLFLENFTAFTLFHEPTFLHKLATIKNELHLKALLATILGFVVRFYESDAGDYPPWTEYRPTDQQSMPDYYNKMAFGYIDEAFAQCDDEAAPLILLQALILANFQLLVKGVHGRAWRSLGLSVRVAYELNLHLIDSADSSQTHNDAKRWSDDEERRRAWWAIWEMDVFASTIRRCPTAIDMTQNETKLPSDDESWFSDIPRESCFLDINASGRWKALQQAGSTSAKAWFIVINSYMREAQLLSSPRGLFRESSPVLSGSTPVAPPRIPQSSLRPAVVEVARKLENISLCLRCFTMALPRNLRYRDQFLGFEAKGPGQLRSSRHLHSSIYSIHVMSQLTRLMIQHYYVFRGSIRQPKEVKTVRGVKRNASLERHATPIRPDGVDAEAIGQYFEATENIIKIVDRSCDEHYKYLNPFLARTMWLAAAIQLVRKEFGAQDTDRDLIGSKFEVMCLVYEQFVTQWNMSTALQENLGWLEAQLGAIRAARQQARLSSQQPSRTNQSRAQSTAKTHFGGKQNDRSQTRGTSPVELGDRNSSSRPGTVVTKAAQLPHGRMTQTWPSQAFHSANQVSTNHRPQSPSAPELWSRSGSAKDPDLPLPECRNQFGNPYSPGATKYARRIGSEYNTASQVLARPFDRSAKVNMATAADVSSGHRERHSGLQTPTSMSTERTFEALYGAHGTSLSHGDFISIPRDNEPREWHQEWQQSSQTQLPQSQHGISRRQLYSGNVEPMTQPQTQALSADGYAAANNNISEMIPFVPCSPSTAFPGANNNMGFPSELDGFGNTEAFIFGDANMIEENPHLSSYLSVLLSSAF